MFCKDSKPLIDWLGAPVRERKASSAEAAKHIDIIAEIPHMRASLKRIMSPTFLGAGMEKFALIWNVACGECHFLGCNLTNWHRYSMFNILKYALGHCPPLGIPITQLVLLCVVYTHSEMASTYNFFANHGAC